MAALTGNSIDSSYQGLLKTTDNGAVGGASKAITDGLGNATNIEIGNAVTKFPSGTVDFTGSTVQGLPSSSAGLESGTGTDSIQSAASLTTNAADASAANSMAIGDGVTAAGIDTTAIGKTITTVTNTKNSVMLGTDLSTGSTGNDGTVVIGHGNVTADGRTVAIGYDVDIPSGQGQAMGNDINITGADRSTAIGSGINIDTVGSDKIAIGTTMSLTADRAIGVGRDVTVSGDRAISIGDNTSATASGAVALGKNVTAAIADTVSIKALEVQTDSTPTAGGIIMSDAGGTDRRLNIDASGALQIDSTPVGGGGGSTSHPARYFGSGNLSTTFEGPYTFFSNDITFFAVHLQEGEEVTELAVEVGTTFTSTTSIGMALYDSQIGTSSVEYVPNNKLLDLGTASPATAGVKTFTGSTYTATYTGLYFMALGYNGQWDGTFRQVDAGQRSYHPDAYYISNTTLGFARDFNVAEPIRYASSYGGTMPASFAASQNFSNTSARLALMGKTAQNI